MIKRYTQNPILRSIGGVGAAAIVGQLVALAASPVVSRLFAQGDIGKFGLFFSLANVLVTIATLGLQDALLAAPNGPDARALTAACLYSMLVTSPLLAAATWLLIRFGLFGYGALPPWAAILMAFEIVAIGAVMLFQMSLIRAQGFRRLASGHVTQGVARAASQVGAGLVALAFFGLAAADVVSRALVAVVLGRGLQADLGEAKRVPLREVVNVAWRYRMFPFFRTPSTLAHNLGTALPPALVTMAYGVDSGGVYTLMFGVLVVPAGLVQKAVGDVFLGHFAERFHADRHAARRFLAQVALALLAISAGPALLLGLWGEPMFAFVFGEKWRVAGALASLMIPLLVADLTIGPLGGALNVANRPDAKLVFDALRLSGYASAYLIATKRAMPLSGMVALFAWFGVVAYIVYGTLIYFSTRYPRLLRELRDDRPAISSSPLP